MTKTVFKETVKVIFLWLNLGIYYFAIEGLWRIRSNGGWANVLMILVGGLCGVVVGGINQIPALYKLKVIVQALIGAAAILCVEFAAGYLFNIVLGLKIWNYSNLPLNIMGQVCVLYGVFWFLIAPFAIWMEDSMRFEFFKEGKYYSLFHIYREFFTLK